MGDSEQINGREAGTATFLSRRLFTLSLCVARSRPRHFNRSTTFCDEAKMAYEIHIERVNDNGEPLGDPITLSEWKIAVENQKNVRLTSDDIVGTNPVTGEVIRISNSEGDAEVYFPEESNWYRVYRWRKGRITFKGLPSFDNPNDPIRQTTRSLATTLEAKIVGDEGELYD